MNNTLDQCTETPSKHMGWNQVSSDSLSFPWRHERPIKVREAQEAVRSIEEQVKGFPFQIRFAMALPLWYRYSDSYCQSGDQEKALREIL